MKSMTGYGRYEDHIDNVQLTVEIKSVNHRYCEIDVHLPRNLTLFEEQVKKVVRENIYRGRVDVYIHIDAGQWKKRTVQIDWGLAEAYFEAADRVKKHFGLEGKLSIQDFLAIPECFVIQEEADPSVFEERLGQAVRRAMQDLTRMRASEGVALAHDLRKRVGVLQAALAEMNALASQVHNEYQRRLETRVRELLDQRAEVDESRLLQEVALLAEKSNIDEELTRLESHLRQFENLVAEDGPVGRKLDFLLQEMHREINTIGSKAQVVAISQHVIDVKGELEKIREQVQNIE